MKKAGATVIDSDYEYIGVFIRFLDQLITVIDKLFNNLVAGLANLSSIGAKDGE